MKTYLVLFLLIAIAIPMAIKFSINNNEPKSAMSTTSGPCLINNFDNFSNKPLRDRVLPKNLDNFKNTDAFQQKLDNHPKDGMINMDTFKEDNSNRVGQNCQYGLCLPGQDQPSK